MQLRFCFVPNIRKTLQWCIEEGTINELNTLLTIFHKGICNAINLNQASTRFDENEMVVTQYNKFELVLSSFLEKDGKYESNATLIDEAESASTIN